MLATPLNKVLRTTSNHLRRLKELGIETVSDFLLNFPWRYTDQREVCRIIDIQIDAVNIIRGHVKSISQNKTWRRRMSVITALVSDSTGSVEVVWFHQPYLQKTLVPGVDILLSGKAKYDSKRGKISLQNPSFEIVKENQIHTARIVPIYHETDLNTVRRVPGKISSKWIREKLFPLIPFAEYFPEFLPEHVRETYRLMPLAQAIRNVHFPESEVLLDAAKRRMAFDELFLLQLAALHRRYLWRKIAKEERKQISANWDLMKEFTASLPWKLTNAQKKAIYEILKDLEKPFPMSRLLEGDTGSGKTVVAAAAILNVLRAKFQSLFLAPTEILARQHMETLSRVLKPFEIKPRLLIGATKTSEKKEIAFGLKTGEIPLVVGTHALLNEKITWNCLGLAIIDEQHRFGVRQREILKTHGSPHVLSLTATPIPRTLALILYGDCDLSVLDEMPPGRQKIITRVVPEEKRSEAYRWIEREIGQGRQAFIIFPLIEESEILCVKAATREFERLQNEIFPRLKIGLLHGQMSSQKKDSTMRDFKEGKIQILVSTAVVEVGVDVPNATIMVIEGAERFGLAQLHQFRGRVGRRSDQSYCFLFPTGPSHSMATSLMRPKGATFSPQANSLQRLNSLTKYHSGFKLAEVDLQMRGPGEVFGTAQSGIPDLKMANLSDAITMKEAREAAGLLLNEDPVFTKYPELKKKILEQQASA